MAEKSKKRKNAAHLSEEQIRAHTIGELVPLTEKIRIVEYDPRWPELFEREAARIREALGPLALCIEHTGSTSVPELVAKPVIDMLLVVADSSDEEAYAPALVRRGYTLRIREPRWHEHRMFRGPDTEINLHVFSSGCREAGRILAFRDWLRTHPGDCELYARAKRLLAEREWKYIQNYADAKSAVIQQILARARQQQK